LCRRDGGCLPTSHPPASGPTVQLCAASPTIVCPHSTTAGPVHPCGMHEATTPFPCPPLQPAAVQRCAPSLRHTASTSPAHPPTCHSTGRALKDCFSQAKADAFAACGGFDWCWSQVRSLAVVAGRRGAVLRVAGQLLLTWCLCLWGPRVAAAVSRQLRERPSSAS